MTRLFRRFDVARRVALFLALVVALALVELAREAGRVRRGYYGRD
jgi:hypothetical protein